MAVKRAKTSAADDSNQEMAQSVVARQTTGDALPGRHKAFGWTLLAVSLLFGTTLEALLAFKSVTYLMDPIRREMWSLAHFHGASLSIVNLVYERFAAEPALSHSQRRTASLALVAGSLLMPLGFLLGGLSHPEGDPGFGVLLSPAGAICIVFAVGTHAVAAWRR